MHHLPQQPCDAVAVDRLPRPYDAVSVDRAHPSGNARSFTGTTRSAERSDLDGEPDEATTVAVLGVQRATGSIDRWLSVRNAEGPMTPAEARRLARLLIAAADEIQLYVQEGI